MTVSENTSSGAIGLHLKDTSSGAIGLHLKDFQFIDKFLKFEVMEYFIHCVLNRSSLILCKLLPLYSILKLKLESNFSQFIHRFIIGIFEW